MADGPAETATIEPPATAIPPGGPAFAGEEEQVEAVSEGDGFNGRGKAQLSPTDKAKFLDHAETLARSGNLPPRDESGRFKVLEDWEKQTKAEAPLPAAKPPAPKPEATPEPEAEKPPTDPRLASDSDEMRAARKALLRDGYEPEDLKDWSAEKMLKVGITRAQHQAKQDRRFYEMAKKAGEPTDRIEIEEPQQDTREAEQAALADLLFGRTTGQGGEGSTDEFSEVLADLNEEAQGKLKSALDHRGKVVAKAQEAAARAVGRAASLSLRVARTELASEYPFLKEPGKWQQVLQELAGIDRDKEIVLGDSQERVNSLVSKAVYAAFGESIVTERRAQAVATNRRERAAVPHEGSAPPSSAQGSISRDKFMAFAQDASTRFPGDVAKARAYLNELVGGRSVV